MRVLCTAQDPQTIRDAFDRAKPNAEYANLYAAAVARRQADQIYNLSLTRTATVMLGKGARRVIGVGRVKTPTLGIVCKRELEIRAFVPEAYFEVIAVADVAGGRFQMRHAPPERIIRRERAEEVLDAAQGFTGALAVRIEDKRQGPPKLHDLPSLQKLCGSRFGWSASKTLEVAQELYDGQGKKVITYPRAEVRYLPESLIPTCPGLSRGCAWASGSVRSPCPSRQLFAEARAAAFTTKASKARAITPSFRTSTRSTSCGRSIWPRLSLDEKKLFDVIARAYLASLMPDFRYRQTTATLDVKGFAFRAAGRQPIDLGWRAAFPDWRPADEKGDEAQWLPALQDGETARLRDAKIEDKETRPPPRYNEGSLIEAMQNAWRFVDDELLRERLKEAKGIGTPATRAEIIGGLKKQAFLMFDGKHIVPTETGLLLFGVLKKADPALVDPGVTAQLEYLLDDVVVGKQEMVGAIDAVCEVALRIIGRLTEGSESVGPPPPGGTNGAGSEGYPPTPAMRRYADSLARQKRLRPPVGYDTSISICRAFLNEHAAKKADGEVREAEVPVRTRIASTVRKGEDIADIAKVGSSAKSGPFNAKRAAPRAKRGRKLAADTASPSNPPKKHRTGKREVDPSPSGFAQSDSVSDTPLKIPYGNKEIAMKLGARYGAGGWYAPPGIDLSAFRERGWS